MNEEHDNDLRAIFAQQRHEDHEDAPAWQPERLNRSAAPPRMSIRWIPASLATACVVLGVLMVTHFPQTKPQLSELPPLFDAPQAELFANVDPPLFAFEAPSDFLLPNHLNH